MKSNLIELADIPSMGVIVAGIVLLVVLVMGIVLLNFGMIYIRALFSGAKAKISELIALRLRRVPVGLMLVLYELIRYR